ncbi:MAG TPA: ketoacyl-ACP synthase III [Bryobacteraceae bacterium]
MAFLRSFGCFLPERIVPNSEIAARIGKTAEWIEEISGIRERRWAGADVLVSDLAVAAAHDCLGKGGLSSSDIGMIIVSSGSSERRFPGPASVVGQRLGVPGVPCLDVPIASAGSLFAMSLASRVAEVYGNVLVVAAEKMSAVVDREPMDLNTGILFGDGAGACLISAETGRLRIVDSVLHSDGSYADDLKLGLEGGLQMNGMPVIMQASRKMPAAINEILAKHSIAAETIDRFVMHQANQNLINRVAKSVGVPAERFYTNIAKYGNTSSASMLIAASECWMDARSICFATFGAGFHWGALLAA